MTLPGFMQNWPIWAVLVALVGLPAYRTLLEFAKWFASFVSGRNDVNAGRMLTAQEQFEAARRELMKQLQDDLTSARGTMQGYEMELSKLRRARSSLADTIVEVRTAAIAARAMVHDLERRLGDSLTVFNPLPPIDDV